MATKKYHFIVCTQAQQYICMFGLQVQENVDVVCLSHGKAGKNHFLNEYMNSAPGYTTEYTTSGVDDNYKILDIGDQEYMFRLINVNSKPQFDSVAQLQVKDREIFIVFYDVNQVQTQKTQDLIQLIDRTTKVERVSVLMVGTKTDLLKDQDQGLTPKIKELFGSRNNFTFIEISCKQEEKVEEAREKVENFIRKAMTKIIKIDSKGKAEVKKYEHWSDQLKDKIGGVSTTDLECFTGSKLINSVVQKIQKDSEEMILIKKLLYECQITKSIKNELQNTNRYQSTIRLQNEEQINILKGQNRHQQRKIDDLQAKCKELQQKIQQYQSDGSIKNLKLIQFYKDEIMKLQFQIDQVNKIHKRLELKPEDRQKLEDFHNFAEMMDKEVNSNQEVIDNSMISSDTYEEQLPIRKHKRQGLIQKIQKYKQILTCLLHNNSLE